MLQKEKYSPEILEIFKNSIRKFPEIDFDKFTNSQIVQYAYLGGAKKIKKDIVRNGYSDHLNLPSMYMYTQCDLSPLEEGFRNQNTFIYGAPGSGKTHLSTKLTKSYFCEQFIPEKYRESEDFFNGIYAQGITKKTNYREIVFVSESHCIDMFSRNIKQIDARDHFPNYPCYGSWDLEDLLSADFLVIQDIGSRKAHPQFAETLFSIIDTRFEDLSKITILTSNKKQNVLSDIYGQMFIDRLKTFMRVEMEEGSKRKFNKITRTKQKFQYYTGE